MKDTAKFGKLVEESNGPVIVTRNGSDAYAVMTSDAYDAIRQDLARMKLCEIVDRAEAEFAAEEYVEGGRVPPGAQDALRPIGSHYAAARFASEQFYCFSALYLF